MAPPLLEFQKLVCSLQVLDLRLHLIRYWGGSCSWLLAEDLHGDGGLHVGGVDLVLVLTLEGGLPQHPAEALASPAEANGQHHGEEQEEGSP